MIFEICLYWENKERFKKTLNLYPVELQNMIINTIENLPHETHYGKKTSLNPKFILTTWKISEYLLYVLSDVDEKVSVIQAIGKMCVSFIEVEKEVAPLENIFKELDKSIFTIIEAAKQETELFFGGAPPPQSDMRIDSKDKDEEELKVEPTREKKKKDVSTEPEHLSSGLLTALSSFATESSEEEMRKFNEKIARKATVFYRNRMIAEETNKLAVAIASHKIHEKLRLSTKEIARASTEKELMVTDSNPIIDIEPVFPNCICVPATRHLDARKEYDLAGFLITPLSTGDIPNAHINLFNNGRLIDTIETPVKVVKTTAAKISGLVTLVIPTIGQLFEDVITPLFEDTPLLSTSAGFGRLLLGLAAVCAFISLILYLMKKPRDAKPLHKVIEDQNVMDTVLSSMKPEDLQRILEQK